MLSADPAGTAALHGVEARPRTPLAVWQALGDARMLISGGGSLVQDATSARSALYYVGVMFAASLRRVPLVVVGQGIGPVRRAWVRYLAAAAFERAQAIDVRDPASAAELRAMGVSRRVDVGADLAALMPAPPPGHAEELLAASGLAAPGPRLGAVVRPWKGLVDVSGIGRGLRRFAATHGARIAVLPFDHARDMEISRALASASGGRVVPASSPQDLLGLVGAMDLVLGVRLHALIFATMQGVPALALAYDPKVTAFAARAGLPAPLGLSATEQEIEAALAAAWRSRAEARLRQRAAAADLAAAASASIGRVAALLLSAPA